jgi:hypothetical protein
LTKFDTVELVPDCFVISDTSEDGLDGIVKSSDLIPEIVINEGSGVAPGVDEIDLTVTILLSSVMTIDTKIKVLKRIENIDVSFII